MTGTDPELTARARIPHAPAREVVVHPGLARPAAPELTIEAPHGGEAVAVDVDRPGEVVSRP